MVVTLDAKLEAALHLRAKQQGVAPDELALSVLREKFLPPARLEPRDEWERGLLESARDWGVSFTDAELSRESMYE
jgi:hypothetical protein